MTDEPKITLKVKLDSIFQIISNKVTSWSQTPSNDKYPSEKLVKDSLDDKISKSNTNGLIKNDGTIVQSGTGVNNWATGNHTHEQYIQNQKFYFDGDDFVIISNESTITKTLTIVWNDNDNVRGLRPRYLQPTINGITAYLSEESEWSVSIPVDTEDTYIWSVPSVVGYTQTSISEVDNVTTVTLRIRTTSV